MTPPSITDVIRDVIAADMRQVQFLRQIAQCIRDGCDHDEILEVIDDAAHHGDLAIHRNTALLATLLQ